MIKQFIPPLKWVGFLVFYFVKEIKNCTISRMADQWYISFKKEREKNYTVKKFDHVGVDLGIKTLATLSNGEVFENLKPYKNAKKKLRKQQKEVSRRFVEGADSQSNNYKKSVNKLAKTHATVANVRKDCIHKITTYLAKNFETVIIENLKPKNMSKNHNLASAILDGGFYEFKRQLLYKKRWYGGMLLVANQFYPSSKLCSCCKNKKSDLKLSDRTYVCDICGYIGDRDLNSGINLDDLNKLAVSSTVLALGDESPTSREVQLVDELGMKHQLYIFV